MKKIGRSAIVEHSAQRVYALVEDIESYPRFLPWCTGASVERGAVGVVATLQIGMRGLRQTLTTRNENQPGTAIDMRLVSGPFRHFAACWRFKSLSPQACGIEFSLEYEFSSKAAGKLLEPLFGTIANTMVDAFSRRADEIHKG